MVRERSGKSSDKSSDKPLGEWLALAARRHRARAAAQLRRLGLHPGQERILLILAEGGDMPMASLTQVLKVRAPTVSKAITRLQREGFLNRVGAGADARMVIVSLTSKGHECINALKAMESALEEAMTEGLDGKDRKRLRRLLRRIARNLSPESQGDQAEDDGEDGTLPE
jgi:MarR family transcriptional regulator, organic hydroperoxide resistance regulator